MKVMIQSALGHPRSKKFMTKIDGHGHEFRDVTNRPAETITTRPVALAVDAASVSGQPESAADKPPYRIPTLQEINALPQSGLNVISLFAGTGGSSLGYRMAGFRVLFANEFIEAARDSYAANARPGTIIDGRDIRKITPQEILDAVGLKPGELDVLDGSPPCASFSTAGIKQRGWNRIKKYSDGAQRADDLFYEYLRILDGIRPKVFIAENVSGLIKGVAKGYFLDILKRMKALGYRVEARLLDAQWLGVPQRRRRIFFVGVRDDLGRAPAFPKPLPYRYTLREALPWIDRAVHDTSGQFSEGEFTDKPSPTITVGVEGLNAVHYKVWDVEPEADMSRYETGKEWNRLAAGAQSERYFSLVKPPLDGPSPTVTASGGIPSFASVTHPLECRKFSIGELKRICGFPEDFILTGNYAQQWERLGRAVPPIMMERLATAIRQGVFEA